MTPEQLASDTGTSLEDVTNYILYRLEKANFEPEESYISMNLHIGRDDSGVTCDLLVHDDCPWEAFLVFMNSIKRYDINEKLLERILELSQSSPRIHDLVEKCFPGGSLKDTQPVIDPLLAFGE